MSNVWFTSDLHIGHTLVATSRGFDFFGGQTQDVEAHDDTLADRWDETVHPDDTVWVLGDLSSGSGQAQAQALSWIMRRPGVKHLVAGNHDGCHPMNRDAAKHLNLYLQTFASVQPFARRRIGGQSVLLSHFPYDGDHTEVSRFDQYRLRDYGMPLLHGHTHKPGRVSRSPAGTLQIHVGVDAWDRRPASLEDAAQLIAETQQ